MTEEQQRRFECLDTLRKAAFDSFDKRRSYEWKLSLAIWTALAVVVAGLLQPEQNGEVFPVEGAAACIVAGLVALVVVGVHSWWSKGAHRANGIDKDVSLHFAKKMQEMLKDNGFDASLKARISALPETGGWWSHMAQIMITALLAASAVVIMALRST